MIVSSRLKSSLATFAGGGSSPTGLTLIGQTTSTNSSSFSIPSGYQDGDLLVVACGGYYVANRPGGDIAWSESWTGVDVSVSNTAGFVAAGVGWQIVSGTPSSSGVSVSWGNDRLICLLFRASAPISSVTLEDENGATITGSGTSISRGVTGTSNGLTLAIGSLFVSQDTSVTFTCTDQTDDYSYTNTHSMKAAWQTNDTGIAGTVTFSGSNINNSSFKAVMGAMLTLA